MLKVTPPLSRRLMKWFASFIPTEKVTLINPYAEQSSMTEDISVENIHNIIESAKAGDPRELFALYRDIIITDNHLQGELNKRKIAVLGDTLSVEPMDKKNPDDVVAAKAAQTMIDDIKAKEPHDVSSCSWYRARSHLLDSTIWPVAVVEKVYRPSSKPGLMYELSELISVPYYLITYISNQEDQTGILKIRQTENNGYPTGNVDELDPARYIVHRGHLLTTHDVWGGPMRSILFWWLLGTKDREWWGRFLERYGSPFMVGKYDKGDDQSRSVLQRAFQWCSIVGGLVVTRETEVEIIQAASGQSSDGYEKFIKMANDEKSKLILGQTLSTDAKPTGLGSGVAKQHGAVRSDYREFDARMLSETLEDQLISQFLSINGFKGRVKLLWGSISDDEKQALGGLLADLKQAGLEPADEALEDLSEKVGFTLQRAAASAPTPGNFALHALSATGDLSPDLVDKVVANASANLARTFRGSLAPVRRMVLTSASPQDLERQLRRYYSDWSPDQVADVIDQALIATAANGVARVA